MAESGSRFNPVIKDWQGLLIILVVTALLVAIHFGLLHYPIDTNRRAACANNLKQIGLAMQYYASQHRLNWPSAYGPQSTAWNDVGGTRTDSGQDRGETVPVNSNTATLWMLAKAGLCENSGVFICPASGHRKDVSIADPMTSPVRDFANEDACSYSFQNVLGDYALANNKAKPWNLAIAADANPMRRDFWSGAPGAGKNGATDDYLATKPAIIDPFTGKTAGPAQGAWELSSPNHNFEGQNVLYLDGHVDWVKTPYCGHLFDNIWLRRKADAPAVPANLDELRAANDVTSYDGHSTLPPEDKIDTQLVP